MSLFKHLRQAGFDAGLPTKNTSHSGLLEIKRILLSLPELPKGAAHNNFGSALHEQFLEKKKTYKVTKEEQQMINAMIAALNKHSLVKYLMAGSTFEDKKYDKVNGVEVAYILDIDKRPKEQIAADLKSTVCRTQQDFVTKAREYGYFNQAALYMRISKVKMFFFIGVTKELRPKVFILNVTDHPEDLAYANEEVDWLLHVYSAYGKLATL